MDGMWEKWKSQIKAKHGAAPVGLVSLKEGINT